MENNWIKNVSGICPVAEGTLIDVCFRDTDIIPRLVADNLIWRLRGEGDDVAYYRLHKPEQSLDDALGLNAGVTPYVYPQTTFKSSSEAQLRADEEARISNKLSEKLSTISDTLNKITGKNFSVADIKLVKDLLDSVEEYEENR